MPRTKFKNPPVNEVIVGLYFNGETPNLRAEHVGVFWSSIRKQFPKIQQQLPITHPFAVPIIAFELTTSTEPFPMPRFWLESNEPAYLMQIQKDAFLFNWRRRDTENYPHYDDVKQGFDRNFAEWERFLKTEFDITLPPVAVAELTYSNIIEPCEYWKSSLDTKTVLPYFSVPCGDTSEITEGTEFNQVTVQRFASDLAIRTTIRNGKTPKGPCLVFELRCTGGQGNVAKEATDAWFARAHDQVGECFLKMTSKTIQDKYWQPKT